VTISASPRGGITAIEVLASTLLAALLMAALIGMLRGLKAHERTLDAQAPRRSWQQSLDAALASDLQNAATYEATSQSVTLRGRGGRNQEGLATWRPTVVVYEIRQGPEMSWLFRRELPAPGGDAPRPDNLVIVEATEIRIACAASSGDAASAGQAPRAMSPIQLGKEAPLVDGLLIEFWGNDQREPLYSYQTRAL